MSRFLQVVFGSALLLISHPTLVPAKGSEKETIIGYPREASALETLAAHEVRRYIYLRTGRLLPLVEADRFTAEGACGFLVARKDRPVIGRMGIDAACMTSIANLDAQASRLKRIHGQGRKILLITGGGDTGTLYGAYRFAEHLGVRFYLHGDVIPDGRIQLDIPEIDECSEPLFNLRGILPFHDFPEGPDWWNVDDYKSIISQLAKMRMNFIGLHAYVGTDEENSWIEPNIWIGLPEDLEENGDPRFAYKTSFVTTHRGMPFDGFVKDTSEFAFGTSQLFAEDVYGPEFMRGNMPLPKTREDSIDVFTRYNQQLRESFGHARALGVKTCLGSNTPLAVPASLAERLKEQGKDPADPAVKQELYEGLFLRAARAHPLDYYWFWTSESWLGGATEEQIQAVKEDWFAGIAAAEKVNAPFALATCGWVLGPPQDRALFDEWLPKTMPVSCIGRHLGRDPVDQIFVEIEGRSKWAIPWLEDDEVMSSAQLWAGRMRADAVDAHRYGCDGLMGIHWRTRVVGPTLAALAQAAWEQNDKWALASETPQKPRWKEGPKGGRFASTQEAIADTDNDTLYQTVRFDTAGYNLEVPRGEYTVTLRFCEPAYKETGKRVFDVEIQGETVATRLDVFEQVGKHRALDLTFDGIRVSDGRLEIGFEPVVEYPCIAAIQFEGKRFQQGINCGGPEFEQYRADWPASQKPPRDLPVFDFYLDWARHHFGERAAKPIATIFAKMDGKLPRPSRWNRGPGVMYPDGRPWAQVRREYGFVSELASLRPRVKGAGNRARFDYWLCTFRLMKAKARVNCTWGDYNRAIDKIRAVEDSQSKKEMAREVALPIRIRIASLLADVHANLIGTISSPGELGTLSNIEQRTLPRLLDQPGKELEELLGEPLPPEAFPSPAYRGPLRIVIPTVRGHVTTDECLDLRVMILSETPLRDANLYWRVLGSDTFERIPLQHVNRGVHHVTLPGQTRPGADMEYYVEVRNEKGARARFPATGPRINQTVVVTQFDENG